MRGTANSFGRSNFDPSTASDNRPICLSLFPTWLLRDSIASMSIGRHRRPWTLLIRASCKMPGITNSFSLSNFDPSLVSGSQSIVPFPASIWPLRDPIASMSISKHRRPWKMFDDGGVVVCASATTGVTTPRTTTVISAYRTNNILAGSIM